MGKQRLSFIDISRFIGIFLMILGHSGLKSTLTQYIYAFHMPLFFIISGLLSPNDSTSIKEFVVKRAKALIIPYLLFALILCFGENINSWGYVFYGSRTSLHLADSFTPLWFLPCFFCSSIIYKATLNLESRVGRAINFNPQIFFWVAIIGFAFIGTYFPFQNKLEKIGYPFSVNVSFIGVVLMSLGRIIQATNLLKLKSSHLILLSAALYLIGFFTYELNLPDSVTPGFGHVEMAISSYGNILLFLLNAFILTLATISLSLVLDRNNSILNNFFVYIGQNSLLLLCIHGVLLSIARKLVDFTYKFLGMVDSSTNISYYLISTLIVVLLSLLIMPSIIKFTPNLIGKNIN